MILDASLVLSDAQVITATAASSNNIDQLAAGDAYVGNFLVIRVNAAFAAAGAATLTIALECDSDSAFGSVRTLWQSSALAIATLIAGYEIKIRIPLRVERYLRVNYTVATGPFTAGSLDAFIVADVDRDINE